MFKNLIGSSTMILFNFMIRKKNNNSKWITFKKKNDHDNMCIKNTC